MSASPQVKRGTLSAAPREQHEYTRSPAPVTGTNRARQVSEISILAPNRLIESHWFLAIEAATDMVGLLLAWKVAIYLRYFLNPLMTAQLSIERIQELAPPLPM